MKQILQNLGSGETILAEVPEPTANSNQLLIQTTRTLVSLGTEKMLIDFGKGGWIAKARSQPDKVKQVLQKIKTDGLWATLETVKAKLDTPIPLGYCHVGKVLQAPANSRYQLGDRVVSNGNHAEAVAIGEKLTAKIPDCVSDDQAAFTVIGAIGLQGIRLLQPTLGERIVVSGLGLIGLMAVQLLRANGCQVLGIDFDPQKLALARQFGATTCDLSVGQDPVAVAEQWTHGVGVDGVLITASTKSDELIHQAATMCRQRGRIVLVGVIGLNLQRADFYEKELSFQVSCSYGPGRYDPNYEKRGEDYPIGFVRWTEQRNFEAILQLLAEEKLNVEPLITHRFSIDDALKAYEAINERGAMGILLQYTASSVPTHDLPQLPGTSSSPTIEAHSTTDSGHLAKMESRPLTPIGRDLGIAFIGAGGFSTRMLMPLLPKQGIQKISISSASGVTAAHAAKKFGFQKTVGSAEEIWSDPQVDLVFITTPHHLHAKMVCDALKAGKHVFVEKPLALNMDELEAVEKAHLARPDLCLMIGFNRRFSPHMIALKQWSQAAPSNKAIVITVNAGAIPAKHWTQDKRIGGGRIVGEACHFIDLARYLAGSPIVHAESFPIQGGDGLLGDCTSLQLKFADGSIASIHYLANGHKDFPKERIEVFAGGMIYSCDNFRVSRQFGGKKYLKTSAQDKGHQAELAALTQSLLKGGSWPIPATEIFEVSRYSILLA